MNEQPDSTKSEPPMPSKEPGAHHELADQTIGRGFQFLSLSAIIFAAGAITFLLPREEMVTLRSEDPQVSISMDGVERQVSQLSKSPRLSFDHGLSVRSLASVSGVDDTQVDRLLARHSGGMVLVRTQNEPTELLTLTAWPGGLLRRWTLDSDGLVEKSLATEEGMPAQAWTALATVDVNSDGYTDLITGGLGGVGCWLKNPASQAFTWQADACGLVVDGDAWVSSIETLDVNDDGVSDIWLNLMSRRGDGWVGKPNALWLSSNGAYVRGADFLKTSPPSHASYSSSLLDLDRDGVSEIIVSNLDGPIEIWRQMRGFPLVESREYFGIEAVALPQTAALTGAIRGRPFLALNAVDGPLTYEFVEPNIAQKTDAFQGLSVKLNSIARWFWWDHDLDGSPDIVLEHPTCIDGELSRLCGEINLLRNVGKEKLSRFVLHPTPVFPDVPTSHAQFATDVDADGDLDFIVMDFDGGLRLLLNDTPAQYYSLGFSFSDRWAGASMKVSLSDGTEHYEVVQSSNGTRYNHGLWRRFGLREGIFIDRVEIRHPRLGRRDLLGPQPRQGWAYID